METFLDGFGGEHPSREILEDRSSSFRFEAPNDRNDRREKIESAIRAGELRGHRNNIAGTKSENRVLERGEDRPSIILIFSGPSIVRIRNLFADKTATTRFPGD